MTNANADDADNATDGAVVRKSKAKPGERRMAILQAFAAMLEQPMAERVTTAALAGSVTISAGFTTGDTLSWTDQASITASYDATTGVLSLLGDATLATYQTLLRSVAFSSSSEDTGVMLLK